MLKLDEGTEVTVYQVDDKGEVIEDSFRDGVVHGYISPSIIRILYTGHGREAGLNVVGLFFVDPTRPGSYMRSYANNQDRVITYFSCEEEEG